MIATGKQENRKKLTQYITIGTVSSDSEQLKDRRFKEDDGRTQYHIRLGNWGFREENEMNQVEIDTRRAGRSESTVTMAYVMFV